MKLLNPQQVPDTCMRSLVVALNRGGSVALHRRQSGSKAAYSTEVLVGDF